MGPPPPVNIDMDDELRNYWWARLLQHSQDSYMGVLLCKFPEDLRAYEHLLWMSRPDTVIEIGTLEGGSALWFRDRLRTLRAYGRIARAPHVISIDIDQSVARSRLTAADPAFAEEIDLVEDNVLDPSLAARIAALLRSRSRCLVVDDSAHTLETTRAALDGFAQFVPEQGFFVVEDGYVDIDEMAPPRHLREKIKLPKGALHAVDDWMSTAAGAEFTVRRDMEIYGISCHPRGYLQRRARPESSGSDNRMLSGS